MRKEVLERGGRKLPSTSEGDRKEMSFLSVRLLDMEEQHGLLSWVQPSLLIRKP